MTNDVTMPALATLPGVEILAAGTWQLSTGETTFTPEDLAAAVEASQCPAIGKPVIKISHTDAQFTDGEPALGHVDNLELAAGGNKITGDLAGMPGWLGAVAPSAYPQRSIEGAYQIKCSIGHVHPFVITAVALLGVSPPGVGVLNGLDYVAGLYGVNATISNGGYPMPVATTGDTWKLYAAGGSNVPSPNPQAAGVTTEDVRRAYYASGVPLSWWIAEMQMSPAQLIVCDDAEDKVYRVPFKIAGSGVSFSDPVEVTVEYADVAATRGTGTVLVYASAADSRQGIEPEPNPEPEVEPEPVDAAAPEPGSMTHGTYSGSHSHAHAANGAQGDDETHSHTHTHSGDGDHSHAHASASAATDERSPAVDFTDEQKATIRAALGLADDDEITPDHILAMLAKKDEGKTAEGEPEPQPVAAGARHPALPPGIVALDKDEYERMQAQIAQGTAARQRQLEGDRETALDAAVRAGKFSVARVDHWRRVWNADPEGTAQVLAGLTAGAVPTRDIGAPGEEMDVLDSEYENLFPKEYKRTPVN